MAEVIGTIGAILGLVEFTASVACTISRFLRAVGQVPSVISSVNTHITNWKIHLDALHGLTQQHHINQHLKRLLQDRGVLHNAWDCLKRLNDIIIDATPKEQRHTQISELWDQFTFCRKNQGEVEELLQQLDSNTNHLQLALATSTADTVEILRNEVEEVAMAMVSAQDSVALFSWLEPDFNPRSTNPEEMQFEKSDLQEPDTCTWMTASTLWRDWLQGGSASVDGCRRFMWIHGLPGTGKTILASFLIDKLLDRFSPGQYAKGFAYYYCHQEHDRDEGLPFLRWIVRDLCKQLVPLVSKSGGTSDLSAGEQLKDMDSQGEYSSHRPDRSIPARLHRMWQSKQLSVDILMECLKDLVGQFHSRHRKRVYIIVDAIDESKAPRDRLLDILMTIGTATHFENVSLLMTSRRYPDIKAAIDDLPRIALPMTKLVMRPPATQQPSLSSPTSGSRPREPILGYENHDSHDGHYSPQADEQSSPTKRKYMLISGRGVGEGFDPPATSWRPSSEQPTSPSSRGGRSTSNASTHCAVGSRDLSLTRKQSSPGNRSLASDQDGTSPTKRRLDDTHVSPCTSLSMANPHVEKAIAVYVETRLRGSRRFREWSRPAFLVEMRRTLAAKAGGIFRTVACHLDMIERFDLTDESKILDCINAMPDTIFETYEQILVTLIPDYGGARREDKEFARTALALLCSDTANIPDSRVLVSAARTTLPQLEAQFYTLVKLRRLLGCLVKVTPDPRPRTVFERGQDDLPPAALLSIAHYTVKEFLYSEKAAMGPASFFAVSTRTNQILELRIVFDGLRNFDPNPRGSYKPTRYEEYCLEMTDKALDGCPDTVEEDEKLRQAVFACLSINAPHRAWVANRTNSVVVKQHFRKWNMLSPFEPRGGIPSYEETSILVNLLLLQWPELARIYLTTLSVRRKEAVWRDTFKLSVQHARTLPQTTLVQMCVSRRRLDFLKIFTAHGVHFQDSRDDVLFRALSEPYDKEDAHGETTLALLKELLEHGADPNPQGFQVTPLQVATYYLERNWMQQLISGGAELNAIGDLEGIDPLPPFDGTCDRQWYAHKPLKICTKKDLDGKLTAGMQRGVERLIRRYLNGEIIVLDN